MATSEGNLPESFIRRRAPHFSSRVFATVLEGRIAQIESGVGTSKVTFDVLLNILNFLGYDFKVSLKKSAA